MTDFAAFTTRLDALVRTEDPPAPRNAAEHALAVGAAAFAAWTHASTAPERSVPVGELVRLRQRCREAEAARDEALRHLAGTAQAQLEPRGRHVAGRNHCHPERKP